MHDKMKQITSVFFFLFFIPCLIGQNKYAVIYDAINAVLKIQKIESLCEQTSKIKFVDFTISELIQWCKNDSIPEEYQLKIDSSFLKPQLDKGGSYIRSIKWDREQITPSTKLMKNARHYYSLPYFINKKRDAFITFHSISNGSLTNTSCVEAYQKVYNQWRLVCVFPILRK